MANLRANGAKSIKRSRPKRSEHQSPARGIPTITALAEMIGDAVRGVEQAEDAGRTAREISQATQGSRGKTHQRVAFLALDMECDAQFYGDHKWVLEKLLFRLEPHTPEEVFSLALLVATELERS